MDSGQLLALLSTLSCVALGLGVTLRRERSVIASTVLPLLVANAIWSSALGFARWTGPGPWTMVAVPTPALGAFGASGLWLLLALRQRWPCRLGAGLPMALALAPAGLFLVAGLTDESHGFAFRAAPTADGIDWAGPLTRVLFAIAFACITTGAALFAHAAVRLWRDEERRPGLALLLVMLAQPIASFVDLRGEIGPAYPLAASSLTLATLVLATTLLRYALLQPPPLGHRQVIDHLRHGVLIANAAGEILDHNAAAERMLGGHPRGRRVADAVAALAPNPQREPIRAAIDGLEETLDPVFVQIDADRRRHLEVSVRPIASDRGSSLGQVATIRDRTAERSYAEAALRTQKLEAVGTLAAGVAHEVNNPLAFVRANLGEITRLAELTQAWRAKHDSALADALAELGELAHEALAGLSRIQRAVSDVRRLAAAPDAGTSAVSIDAVVLDAVRLLELRASGRVEIRTHFAPGVPRIRGSRSCSSGGARPATQLAAGAQGMPEPWIEVETGATGDTEVWVRVRDNRPALPDALRERIHEPYWLAARDASGRGLGTSLAAGSRAITVARSAREPRDDGAVFVLRLRAWRLT